jgi:hypothetical protein
MIVNPYINPYDIAYHMDYMYQNLNLLSGLIRVATHLLESYMVDKQFFPWD